MTTYSRIAVALFGLLCSADIAGQAGKVQVGYCSTLKNIDAAKAAGFDYLELGTSEIAALSDDEFEKAVVKILDGRAAGELGRRPIAQQARQLLEIVAIF